MSQPVEVIYENGVLRPLQPLTLSEHARVHVVILPAGENGAASKIEDQKAAWRELWEELSAVPQAENNDGWSAKDADDVLYGPQQ